MTEEEFTRRAKCRECGAGAPEVIQHPRPKSRW
jgi:hypothetical protein